MRVVRLFALIVLAGTFLADGASGNAIPSQDKAVNQTVCYDGLGCFSTEPPFVAFGRIALLPRSPETLKTRFDLYTRSNADKAQVLVGSDVASVTSSHFNHDLPTKLVIHGWNDNHKWVLTMKDELLAVEDCNVIVVKWTLGGLSLYAQAAADARVVGAQIAQVISLLMEGGADVAQFHILAHSLGAHAAGYAGERLPNLGRITGMDPAEPYFQHMDPLVRLDPTDASFVDVIHTDAGDVLNLAMNNGGAGLWQPSGHVDIYPNGGIDQEGCGDKRLGEAIFDEGLIDGVRYFFGCRHERGYEYPTEAVASKCPWRSYRCDGGWNEFKTGRCLRCPAGDTSAKFCNSLGTKAVAPSDGSVNNMYWLMTGPEEPFCRYHFHVELAIASKDNKEQKGLVWVKLIGSNNSATGFIQLGEENFYMKPAATYSFLVATEKALQSVEAVELKWKHDAKFYEVDQWQLRKPKIYPGSVKLFSGEFQYEKSFCDGQGELKSKQSRRISPC